MSQIPNGHLVLPNTTTLPVTCCLSVPPKSAGKPDAGLRSLDHYQSKLPSWRYRWRQWLIPMVRWETEYLAWMQDKMRCPALDSYFSITANLGTHTFFMVVLPILFWCGYTNLGRGLVHILATGVFFSGFLKDLLCLPRPLSPPLQRITMSGSVALEYGFPSTHSTNAVSVAVYTVLLLRSDDDPQTKVSVFMELISYAYATSIIIGRLYCGMHGFFDVVIGGVLGAILSVIQHVYGQALDNFLYTGTFRAPAILILVILVLVRIHPEPADDCPCFDDSVAFAGVIIGIELGYWHYAQSGLAWNDPVPATAPFQLQRLGWPTTVARVVFGIVTIFAWREFMKPSLLRGLPPIFRVVERLGLSLPRKFFVQASEYKKIPKHLKDDNVMPSVSDFPSILTSIRHPRRSRSISVGPQSEADAYETLAYRQKRRRDSLSDPTLMTPVIKEDYEPAENQLSYFERSKLTAGSKHKSSNGLLPIPSSSNIGSNHKVFNANASLYIPLTPGKELNLNGSAGQRSEEERQIQREEKEMFSKLEKPRVRYDVEVITKLIVYTGIAWIAVEGNPILFELIGLGLGKDAG